MLRARQSRVELPREESRRRLQNLIRPPQLAVFPAQPLQLGRFLAGRPRPGAGVHLGLPHPLAQGLTRGADLRRDRADRLPLRAVWPVLTCSNTSATARSRTSRGYFLLRAMIRFSTPVWSLHQTRGGSDRVGRPVCGAGSAVTVPHGGCDDSRRTIKGTGVVSRTAWPALPHTPGRKKCSAAVSSQGVAPVDHAVWGGIQGLAVSASRMASMGRRPWLRALTR